MKMYGWGGDVNDTELRQVAELDLVMHDFISRMNVYNQKRIIQAELFCDVI